MKLDREVVNNEHKSHEGGAVPHLKTSPEKDDNNRRSEGKKKVRPGKANAVTAGQRK